MKEARNPDFFLFTVWKNMQQQILSFFKSRNPDWKDKTWWFSNFLIVEQNHSKVYLQSSDFSCIFWTSFYDMKSGKNCPNWRFKQLKVLTWPEKLIIQNWFRNTLSFSHRKFFKSGFFMKWHSLLIKAQNSMSHLICWNDSLFWSC